MNRTHIGSGSECDVFDVGNGRCYKEYYNRGNTGIAYENAKRAFAAGIAPEVYERDNNGYYTEIVETFSYLCKKCEDKDYRCEDTVCDYAFDIIGREKYDGLCIRVCEIFGECADVDLHIHNIGRKNGKLVAIDFGQASDMGDSEWYFLY